MRVHSSRPMISAGAALCVSATLCAAANDERALQEALAIVQLLRAGYNGMVPQRRFDYEDVFGAHPSSVATSKPPSSIISSNHTELLTKNSQSSLRRDSSMPLSITEKHRSASSLKLTVSTTLSLPLAPPSSIRSSTQASLNQNHSKFKLITFRSIAPSKYSTKSASSSVSHLHSSRNQHPHSNLIKTDTSAPFQPIHSLAKASTSALTFKLETTTVASEKIGLKKQPTLNRPNVAVELQQVAMELAGELKVLKPGWHGYSHRSRPRPAVTSKRPAARATWREYLAHSTPYPVPLPENHSFCYTNPRNALCRTFI